MPLIQQIISTCEWDTVKVLFFSGNVFDQFIYYSHFTPLLGAIIVGFFVFFKDRKSLLSKILFFITLTFSSWVIFDLILWATNRPSHTMFFWTLQVIIEPLIYAACLYFTQVFITGEDTQLRSKVIIGICLLPTLILAPTRFALIGFDLTNCDREAIEGPLTQYGYLLEIVFAIWIVLFGIRSYQIGRAHV